MIIKTSTRGLKTVPVKPCLRFGKVSIRKPKAVPQPVAILEDTREVVQSPSAWVADFQARKAKHNPRAEWEGLWK